MNRKISLSIFYFQNTRGDKEALTIARQLGLDAVDFSTESERWDFRNPNSIYAKSDEEIAEYFMELRRHADTLGIEIGQTHGRIRGYSDHPEENEAYVRNARLDCLAAGILGASSVIVHGVTTGAMGPDTDPKLMHQLNFELFTRILPFAKQYGVTIASETLGDSPRYQCCDFFGNINEFIKSYNRVCAVEDNARYLSACVDTGHSNKASRFAGNPSSGDVIRMLGSRISTLHLNDNDTLTDQHKPPMTGTLDWNDIFDALEEVHYQGNYNMELNLSHFGNGFEYEAAEFSVKLMRHMLRQRYGNQA